MRRDNVLNIIVTMSQVLEWANLSESLPLVWAVPYHAVLNIYLFSEAEPIMFLANGPDNKWNFKSW